MFEVTLITESANHKCYRVSLRSSSKRVPSNPSPNGVEMGVQRSGKGDSRVSGFYYQKAERFVTGLEGGLHSERDRPQNISIFHEDTGNSRLGSVIFRDAHPQVHQYGKSYFDIKGR